MFFPLFKNINRNIFLKNEKIGRKNKMAAEGHVSAVESMWKTCTIKIGEIGK